MPQPGAITRIATNVDMLLVPDQLNEFGCASLVQQHRDEGVYTHILIDSGGEDAVNVMYQVGGATSDLTVILLEYSQLPEHDDSAAAFQWITSQAPPPPQPPAAATLQPWIRWCTAELRRQFGTLAQQGQALFGAEVWDAEYEPSLGYLAFEAWVAVNPADQHEFRPEWNLGRPLRDETKSLAYLEQLEKSAQAPLADRDHLGVPERPHRTAALCVDVDGDHRYWAPIACRLSANGPVTVLHTAIPSAPDEPQRFHQTLAGQKIYRQAAAEIDQLARHCEGSCPLPMELVTRRRSPAQRASKHRTHVVDALPDLACPAALASDHGESDRAGDLGWRRKTTTRST
jgi:hypothetical protein